MILMCLRMAGCGMGLNVSTHFFCFYGGLFAAKQRMMQCSQWHNCLFFNNLAVLTCFANGNMRTPKTLIFF